MGRRLIVEQHPGGVLLRCRDCPSYRAVYVSAAAVASAWAQHLIACHSAHHAASSFLSKRRTRGTSRG